MKDNYFLVFNVILDWDSFILHQSIQRKTPDSSFDNNFLRDQLRRILKDTDVTVTKVVVSFQDKNTSNLYYETESIIRLTANVHFEVAKSEDQVKKFLNKLISRNDLLGVYLSLDSSCEESLYPKLSLSNGSVSQRTDIKSLKLGTIVGLGNFVSYFDSLQVNPLQLKFLQLEIHFRHDLASLHIYFYDPKPGGSRIAYGDKNETEVGNQYELKIKYDAIHSVLMSPTDDSLEVFFILKCPPSLYKKPNYTDTLLNRKATFSREATFSQRTVPGETRFSAQSFGKCNVMSVKLPLVRDVNKKPASITCPWKIISTMKRFIDVSTQIPFYLAKIPVTEQDKSLGLSFSFFSKSKTDEQGGSPLFLPDFMLQKENFNIYYAFNCCISLNHQLFSDLTLSRMKRNAGQEIDWNSFWIIAENKFKESPESVEKTFYDIFHSLERNSFIRVLKDFPVIFGLNRQESLKFPKIDVPGICKIRRAVLTPTRVIFMPPHPFVTSRFFNLCDPSHALRLHIRDDDGLLLSFTLGQGCPDDKQLCFLEKNVKKPLLEGLQVGIHRRYEFLASTSSQLREHGLILYSMDTKNRRAKDLRKSIGDFSKIKCVGKHIARVGQAFSQMLSSIIIDDNVNVVRMNDIKRGKHPVSGNPYTFTDGVGKVSTTMATRITESLDLEEVPSAFQIRYQGCKGLLVLDPTLGPHDVIVLRKSMDKFPSETQSLEILKTSKPRAVYLNRPLICLLDQLGADFKKLNMLLNQCLQNLAQSFLDEKAAVQMLSGYCPFLFSLLDLKTASEAGISVLSDPFLRKILDLILRRNLRELKEKARIKIPFDSGRMMFGVVDEYGILEYGQVFVQYSTELSSFSETKILEGDVMVTKYPCMHPGDVRLFKAVNLPQLKHIKDCIVFPQKGPRPHPNEMAGSDLDGDEYSVIWMKELFIKQNHPPMIFADEPALELNVKEIEDQHVLTFICKFIQSNAVGLIAHAHLTLADCLPEGIFDQKCLTLCDMYSTALDFAKTGKNSALPAEDRPKHFPDFFEKGAERSTYKSDRALGKVYERICLFELALSDSFLGVNDEKQCKPNNDLIHPEWKQYEKIAMIDYQYYSSRIVSLLKEMSVESELCLLSTVLERDARYFSGKNDAADLQILLERIVSVQFKTFRQRFQDFPVRDVCQEERLKKASAYYMISHRMNQQTLHSSTSGSIDTRKKLFAFHWVASKELAQMTLKKRRSLENSAFSNRYKVVSLIDEFVQSRFMSEDSIEESLEKLSLKDAQELAVEKILRPWIIGHPIHNLRLVFDNDSLLKLLKQFVDMTCVHLLDFTEEFKFSRQSLTVGRIIVETLQQLVDTWIMTPKGKDHLQLGLAAIITMNRVLQTTSIDPLVMFCDPEAGKNVQFMSLSGDQITMRHYHISLVVNNEFARLVSCHPSEVLWYLKKASDVVDITANHHAQGSYNFWLITAIGTKWQLDILNNIIIQKSFFSTAVKIVAKVMQKRRDHDEQKKKKKDWVIQ